MNARLFLLVTATALACVSPAATPTRSAALDVIAAGAKPDGVTLNTAVLQQAIDAANAAGGGVVEFPAGRFLSGTLQLKSNVTLRLDPGAVLLASPRMADYAAKRRHLLYAEQAENIAIEGSGAIDGHGDAFFDAKWKPLDRPDQLIELRNCRHVRIEDVTIRNAANWTLRPYRCDDVKIRGISLLNAIRAINTDGIQVHGSRNVIISDCHIEAGDDCMVLKTDTNSADAPTENVTVTNCVLVSAASALKFGTGGRADFRHCLFTNIVIRDSRTGIAVMEKDGGTIEDVRFSNIVMTTAPKWGEGVEWPIVVDIEKRTNESPMGHIRDLSFDGITVYTKGRILVEGAPESAVENVTFRDVTLRVGGYEAIEHEQKPRGGSHSVADNMPDYGTTPAAFIFAHVRGLTLDGVRLTWPAVAGASDVPYRHAIFGDAIADARFSNLRVAGSTATTKPFELRNSDGVSP